MKRRVFTILSALSLVLFVATCVMWVRSHLVFDHCRWSRAEHDPTQPGQVGFIDIETARGRTGVHVQIGATLVGAQGGWRHESKPLESSPPITVGSVGWFAGEGIYRVHVDRFGFAYYRYDETQFNFHDFNVIVPIWFLAAITAALPTLAVRQASRRARRRSGNLCAKCGYDLRATPDRCPECGQSREDAMARS